MPRAREGYARIEIEMPEAIAAAVRKKAGTRLAAYVTAILAAEVGVPYEPPPLGRRRHQPEPEPEPPAKPRARRSPGRR